ncbi:hypothetical protein DXV76_11750 [Rhodobacteraceae bacterium CCMM004]|nr:hypothetical protein DXV76_11750 [Rhodobacteraceae bacterium CCMM004]
MASRARGGSVAVDAWDTPCRSRHDPLIAPPEARYQPEPAHTHGQSRGYIVNQRRLASMVGVAAFALPTVLSLTVLADACARHTISHYYYEGLWGAVFVGAIAFIGAFLFAYAGETRAEDVQTSLAGLAAVVVALVPTSGPGCSAPAFGGRVFADVTGAGPVLAPPRGGDPASHFALFPGADWIHGLAAVLLFAWLAYTCLVVFTRVKPDQQDTQGRRLSNKRRRDRIYRVSGAVIAAVVLAMVGRAAWLTLGGGSYDDGWTALRLTFWAESVALWAFGVAWVVKGKVFDTSLKDRGAV